MHNKAKHKSYGRPSHSRLAMQAWNQPAKWGGLNGLFENDARIPALHYFGANRLPPAPASTPSSSELLDYNQILKERLIRVRKVACMLLLAKGFDEGEPRSMRLGDERRHA